MQDLVSLVKVRLGYEKAEIVEHELQNILQYAAREGYEGRPLHLGLPAHLQATLQLVMNIVSQLADRNSFLWEQAESLCNRLLHEGYRHGEDCRRYDDIAGIVNEG